MAAFTPIGVQATIKGLSGFNRGLKGMRTGITKTGDAASGVGGKFVGMGKKIASAGAIMAKVAIAGVAALGAAVAGIGVISLKAASDFESAWTGVTKTVDGLVDDAGQLTDKGKELQQGFRDLALEIPASTDELLRLGEVAGQLGVQDDQLLQFTETVAAIGVSTTLAAEDAAVAFARIGNIFNIEAENIGANTEALGNTIVALGNNFATTESEIANFALRMAGAGSVSGFTQADILGIGAAMSSVGVQAERGGTAIQKVMLKMNEAAAASEQGFVDHSEAIAENEQRALDLTAKLVTLEAQTGMLGEELWNEFQAFTAAGGSAEEFGRKLGDTQRAQLFKTIRSIQELTAETNILQDQQGKPISDELLSTFAILSGRTVEQFQEDWQTDAAGVFRDFVAGLGEEGDNASAVLKELELGDQRLIGAFLSLAGAGDLLEEAMALANAEFEDGNALTVEAQKRYQTFESQVQLLKNSLKDIAITIGQPLLKFFTEQIIRIRPLINAFGKTLPAAIEEFKTALGEGGLIGVLRLAGEKFSELGAIIQAQIVAAWPAIRETLLFWAANFWNWLTGPEGAIIQAADRITVFVGVVARELVNQWPAIQVKLMEWASLFWVWLTGEGGVISQIADRVIPVAIAIGTTLAENWPAIQTQLMEWASLFWTWLTGEGGVVSQVTDRVVPVVTAIGAALVENWPAIRDQLLTWGSLFWEWLTGEGGVLEQAGDMLGPALTQIGQVIAEKWPIIAAQLAEWGAQFWTWLTGPGGAIEQAGTELDKIAANFEIWASENEELFVSIGEKIADGILAGIVLVIGSVKFGSLVSKSMSDGVFSVADTFKQIGIDIATGIITGLFERLTGMEIPPVVIEGIKNSLKKIFEITPLAGPQGLLNLITEGFQSLKTILTDLPGLVDAFKTVLMELGLPKWLTPGSPTPLETALANISNFFLIILPESMRTFSNSFIEGILPVQQATQEWNDLLLEIANVTLPHLQEVAQTTASVIVSSFNLVIPVLIEVNSLIAEMASLLEDAAKSAQETAQIMRDEFSKAAEKIESELITALEDLLAILKKIEGKAKAAANAINDMGGATPGTPPGAENVGFQHGANFTVPPGFPGDTFPMRVSSGERVIVIPRSQVDDSMGVVPNLQVGPNTIEDPMSLAMLEATIERVFTRKFG